jgi:hypothetical protein
MRLDCRNQVGKRFEVVVPLDVIVTEAESVRVIQISSQRPLRHHTDLVYLIILLLPSSLES